jgi:hypothetical protein
MKMVKRSGQTNNTARITYYVRDAGGNILTTYTRDTSGANWIFKQKESDIYGGERIGIFKPALTVRTRDTSGTTPGSCISCTDKYWWTINTDNLKGLYTRKINKKEYELKDHLGNVRATVSDRKNSDSTASIQSYNTYYAFGMKHPGAGRSYNLMTAEDNSTGYAYGYNGKEQDFSFHDADGEILDYGNRMYDARNGRPFSPDPIKKKYPELSPYQFFF